ncbi:InlB B-repeat-containing protein [Listeria marthii]|nr:InlB B-repeat-containing protein [Listeria marthii]
MPERLMDIDCGNLNDGNIWFSDSSGGKTPAEDYQTKIYTTASFGHPDMTGSLIDSSWINELARVNTNVELYQRPRFCFFAKYLSSNSFSGWNNNVPKVVWRNQNVFAEASVFSNVYPTGITSSHLDKDIVFFIDGVRTTPIYISDEYFKTTPCYPFRNLAEGSHTIKAVNSGGIEIEDAIEVDYPTISFNSDDGTNVEPLQYSFEDYKEYDDFDISKCPVKPEQILTDPTKKGYTFKGWYKDTDANEYDFDDYRLSDGDITLKAKWDANTYKVTFVDWENKKIASSTVEYEKSATAPTPPARDGIKIFQKLLRI